MELKKQTSVELPTRHGTFTMLVYSSPGGAEHLALVLGKSSVQPVLVRVHSECLTGEVFGSLRCDCGEQLEASLAAIAERGSGVLLYMRQEGRGIGLINKMRAYALQDAGLDTVEANRALGFHDDLRDYTESAGMLVDLGISEVELLTNNPRKIVGLEENGIRVLRRVPLVMAPNGSNARYLRTKMEKMGHLLQPI